jgi:hypothetical protein
MKGLQVLSIASPGVTLLWKKNGADDVSWEKQRLDSG